MISILYLIPLLGIETKFTSYLLNVIHVGVRKYGHSQKWNTFPNIDEQINSSPCKYWKENKFVL